LALKISTPLAKALYALLFNGLLPLGLWLWARAAAELVSAPAVHKPVLGAALGAVGALLVVVGVVSLRVLADSPAMNPWPPARRAARGVYALVAHPIYAGFTLACAGLSLYFASAAGLWLVTPVVALGAAALVLGYEGIELQQRFGPRTTPVLLHLPLGGTDAPWRRERLGAFLVVLVPGLVVGWILRTLGLADAVVEPVRWVHPVLSMLVLAGCVVASTRTALRALVLRAWLGMLALALILTVAPGGPYGGHLEARTAAMIPALLALAAAPALRKAPLIAAAVVAALLVQALGQRATPLELALTVGTALFAWLRSPLWRTLRAATEWLANSWRHWTLGPVRVINHGALGALGCGVGVAALTVLLGPAHAWNALFMTLAATVAAALWAQLIEGSPALARPYGFFGGVLGILAFALATPLHQASPWLLLGAGATAAPLIQGVGRLRCVANGCCHGAPCAPWLGIVYTNAMARPVRLAQLKGVPIHPTQLYSSLSNLLIGAVLARLWASHASLALIGGLYLVLMGLSRFVEEAWRGEPQTPVYAGLRLYQWVSLACVVAGAIVTVAPGAPAAPTPQASAAGLFATVAFVVITWLVASVDFPSSKARFARLA
jgi:protein-S-isoprenylcysteine O-methyltransferase Ste14